MFNNIKANIHIVNMDSQYFFNCRDGGRLWSVGEQVRTVALDIPLCLVRLSAMNLFSRCSAGVMIAVLGVASGCTTLRESYPDHAPAHVWTAMKAVAESPEYDDWWVSSNNVWVDEANSRIEVHRRVDRSLRRPLARPLREEREWRFQITLTSHDPPTVNFLSRGFGVPMHARIEAERYFADVRRMLGVASQPSVEQSDASGGAPHRARDEAESEAGWREIEVLEPGRSGE